MSQSPLPAGSSSSSSVLPPTHRHYRYYDLLMAAFVTVLICSNLIGPAKVCRLTLPFELPWFGRTLAFGAGNIFFPIGYIFGDVLTEVYGYARARKVIWAGFGAMVFTTIMTRVVIWLPVDPQEPFNEQLQPALTVAFGDTPRIMAASAIAFWCGDFVNSYVLARMKIWSSGRFLWTRTIGSTIFGQGVDSLVFYPLAFSGIWTGQTMLRVMAFNWGVKVLVEALFTPFTYLIVDALKKAEHEDYFDVGTDFTPFSLED